MYKIKPLENLKKEISIPPDKSISHRAAMVSSLARGKTVVAPFLMSDDTLATLDCLKKLGIKFKLAKDATLTICAAGMHFPRKQKVQLYAKESGTTIRILSGLLCAQKFTSVFKAAPLLRARPMLRIITPLREMQACIKGVKRAENEYPPLTISKTKKLRSGKFKLKIASAQIKSAIMLAALYADKPTIIREPYQSRDHTHRMLSLFRADVAKRDRETIVNPTKKLISPRKIFIPGDFSSAAFFIVLGLIMKKSELLIKNVNVNHTRCGLLNVLERMGANIKIMNKTNDYEPYADILVKSSTLRATTVSENEIPLMIDEIPILCVAASFAKGRTCIFGVKELKVKETDRIKSMVSNLKRAGVDIWGGACGLGNQGIVIGGLGALKKAKFNSFSDHRTAMSLIIFAMASGREYALDNVKCINKSFPEFLDVIKSLYS
ncbi:MAG: 3-phosphoshikimate 1-carboxyvinyltransferase [Candidatus Omnitrophica bacterium]|nr:3-phosphoshikimate 1-carboxyvinyltransferase [Candidatus Omnitrophota bacterium]